MKRVLNMFIVFFTMMAVFLCPLGVQASGTVTPQISGGGTHTLALKDDGTVWTWGSNEYGELGDGTTIDKTTPVQIMSGVIAISAKFHSLALKDDGTVWAWGHNGNGQLGIGNTTNMNVPTQIPSLTNVIAISAGNYFSLALKNDGTVWAWGHNYSGQLGDGSTTDRLTPFQVPNLSNVVSIVGGHSHSIALKNDGTVWAWGWNASGELGDGTTTQKHSPIQVSNLSNVVLIAGKGSHHIALKDDGTVWAWGYNDKGQLGDGTTTERHSPVQVSALSDFVSYSIGQGHNMAIKSDGTVWSWGYNGYGNIGDGTTTNRHTPINITSLSNISNCSAGRFHSLAVANDGTVWAWGRNDYGQLGDGTTTEKHTPVQIDFNLFTTPTVTAPTNLTATPGDGLVLLNWDSVTGADSYNVKRAETSGGPYTTIANDVTSTSYPDNSVINGTTYYYVVTSIASSTESDNSEEASATPNAATPVPAPTNLTATPGDGLVLLNWDSVTGADSYNVKRAETSGGPYTTIANDVTSTSYQDDSVINGTTYYYVVTSIASSTESNNSEEASATPNAATPVPAPTNLTATPGDGLVLLNWDSVTGADSYNVKRAETSGGPYTTIANDVTSTSYQDNSVTNGTTYYYVVSSVSSGTESDNSNEASATPGTSTNALLEIVLTNGTEKEYDLTMPQVNAFISWFEGISAGSGSPYYSFNLTYNTGPFLSRKDYIVFDKILTFQVNEY